MLVKTCGFESAETDIVLYIAGFVLFRCKKKYSSSDFQKCLQKFKVDFCLIAPCPAISDFFHYPWGHF